METGQIEDGNLMKKDFQPVVSMEAEKQIALEEKIKNEQTESREIFGDLIQRINARYEKLPNGMREDFIAHNEEILNGAIEVGMKNEFSEKELRMLEMAAIWHDACKADAAPEEFKDIPNYALLIHGEKASQEIPEIITDELLIKAGFSKEEFENVRLQIGDAILEHMGPHPGFMTVMLNGANVKLREMGKPEIVHPKAKGKISEALLASDMRSLAGVKGRNKVLAIRYNVPFFKEQDKKTVEEYAKYDIEITDSEAALLSGFDSAGQARDMIENMRNKEWVGEALEDSKVEQYEMLGENGRKVSGEEVLNKQALFNLKKKQMEKIAA